MGTDTPPGTGRELLLLRHAKASREAARDLDRPLTKRGRRDAPRIARWMKAADLVPDLVVSSPSRRTRETTELLVEELALPEEPRFDDRVYEADVGTLLGVVAACPPDARRILVVGHNPGLEDLVRHLGGATAREPERGRFFPTCALARLRVDGGWSELAAGAAPVIEIVSWSRKDRKWRIRKGTPDG